LLVIRTRSSIKYLPKLITVFNMIFLFYLNSHLYSAQFESCFVLQTISLFFCIYFIRHFEYPAINEWNQCGLYTPTEDNPRCGYHNVLLSPDFNIGFDLLTMFYPLKFIE